MRKLLTYILLFISLVAWAQGTVTSVYPYQTSFEEGDATLSSWVLNPNSSTATDQWMMGSAVHSEGYRSLYISSNGTSPSFGRNGNVVVAYLRYKFPTETVQKDYDVSFDWKGEGDSTAARLYVLACPESRFLTNTSANNPFHISKIVNPNSSAISSTVLNACQYLGSGDKYVCGSETWQNVSFKTPLNVDPNFSQNPFVFVFIWVNEVSMDTITRSSIAIDNFQITTAEIKKPANLEVYPVCEDSSLMIVWESTESQFDIQYREIKLGEQAGWYGTTGISVGAEGFTKPEGTDSCSYKLKPILEGTYDVRVRAVNHNGYSSYVYSSGILVYCPDNHCINYIRLDGPNVVCTTGMHEKHTGQTPYDVVGVVDYGPDSENSRHTVHKDPNELDVRADSMLHTVPPGALASVRLGNWNASGKAQSISYTFEVDTTTQGILIMQYALVLDNSGHGRDEEPYFRLEILNQAGQLVDNLCGRADFAYSDAVAAQDLESWHLTTYHGEQLAWKDWTTVGVPLMRYHGDSITVRITTADCGQTVHYGYGYFTLDCANAHIATKNCGNDAAIECVAPDGFQYEWRDETGQIWSTEQTFDAPPSRHTFTCKVSFIEEPDCFFEISTISEPRFPVPSYKADTVYDDCTMKLQFNNTSHVMTVMDGRENHTNEKCNGTQWEIRSLVTGTKKETSFWSPDFMCPNTGDTIEVICTSYIGQTDTCADTRKDTIIMPNIVPENTVIYDTTCYEQPIKFGDGPDDYFRTDTMVEKSFKNIVTGCDSISTLYLKVYPHPQDQFRHDSICSNQSVTIDGVRYNRPMNNELIMMKTEHGCDSALYFTLTVNQLLHAQIDSFPYACADEGQMYIMFDVNPGAIFDSLVIQFSTPLLRDTVIYDQSTNIAIPYPEDMLPGHYMATMTFHQFCCGETTETRGFDIRYRASIVEQKWNDVLTLLSPKYNGGYEFLSFQWYKNDQPIEGETHSYLYQPLDTNAAYYVEVMRADSVVMKTCPVYPTYHEQQSEYPSIVKVGQRVQMYMEQATTIWYYAVSGQLYGSFTLPQGYVSLQTPNQPGVYVLKAVRTDGEMKSQVMIVQ